LAIRYRADGVFHMESTSKMPVMSLSCYSKNMNNKVVINLPVADIETSAHFFDTINFEKNIELSDENAACFDINSETTIALLPSDNFAKATQGSVADTSRVHEVLISIRKSDEDSVNSVVDMAVSAGAIELGEPIRVTQLYGRSFSDLDGHQWNIFCNI
jgi:predicted lactoylglutathione lyase